MKDAHHCLLLEKCKSKLQWDITSYHQNGHHQKNLQTIKAGKGVEKREPTCTVGGDANWYSHYGEQYVWVSHSVMSDSLQPDEPQHARPPCPSPTPGVHPNSCPLSRWCHPTIWSSVVPLSSCPQSFPTSGSFQMSQFFASLGQSIGVSDPASDWSPLGWTAST